MTIARRGCLPGLSSRDRAGEHAGLILARYLENAVGPGEQQHKLDLHKAARRALQSAKVQQLYSLAFERWKSKASRRGSEPIRFQCESPLIIGLGGENVTETGLTLHHTYGVPYLPGTALKGITARYARNVWGKQDPSWLPETRPVNAPNHHRGMFGTQDEGGLIEFSNGWITDTSLKNCLIDEVMTPHHGDYYMAKDADVREPTDFDSPVPVPFLAVRAAFFVAVDKRDERVPDTWLVTAMQLLKLALQEYGIGGKTNAGYGRMTTTTVFEEPAAPLKLSDELPLEVIEVHASGVLGVMSLDGEFAGPIENLDDVPPPSKSVGAQFIGRRILEGDELDTRFIYVAALRDSV